MAGTVYDELVARIRGLVRDEAPQASPPVGRGKVVSPDPLVVDLGDDVVLEEGDPDVEFDRKLLTTDRPANGDAVRVHADGEGWIVGGVIDGGDS